MLDPERIAIPRFKRSNGRLSPTPEAALLFEDVHQSLMAIERIANAASNIKSLKVARLEIAAAPAMALSFLPHTIASFTSEHPETLTSMHTHSTATVIDRVRSGRCDLGFAMLNMRKTLHGNSELLVSAKIGGRGADPPSPWRWLCPPRAVHIASAGITTLFFSGIPSVST